MNRLEEELNHPQRAQLIKRLHKSLGGETIDTAVHACLWLSDIDQLSKMVEKAEASDYERDLIQTSLQFTGYGRSLKTCKLIFPYLTIPTSSFRFVYADFISVQGRREPGRGLVISGRERIRTLSLLGVALVRPLRKLRRSQSSAKSNRRVR